MKRFLAALFLLLIFSNSAFAADQLSVTLTGCGGKPLANQTIQIQKLPCKILRNNDCKWETVESYKTNAEGKISFTLEDQAKVQLDKDRYRFYWKKSEWVYSYAPISKRQLEYSLGYTVNIDGSQPAIQLRERVWAAAWEEFEWSSKNYKDLTAEAEAITDRNVLTQEIIKMMETWVDRHKEKMRKSLPTDTIKQLRIKYVDIKSEKQNSQRYLGLPDDKYAWWCTGFIANVLSRVGGPILKVPENKNAAAFYEWFKKDGNIKGKDGEIYKRTFLSNSKLFQEYAKTKKSPIKEGDFFLEKVYNKDSSGHSAISSAAAAFPQVEYVSGGSGMLVGTFTYIYTKIEEKNADLAIGKLDCIQNP